LLIVVDDYLAILTPLVEQCPDILFLSQAFPTAFNILVGALTLLNTDTTFRALGIIRAILGHDSLSPSQGLPVPPKFPLYAKSIAEVIEKDGPMLVHNLFAGLMEHFAPEMMSGVITTVRILTQLWTASMQQWVQTVLEQMSVPPALEQARTQFILDFNAYASFSRYSLVSISDPLLQCTCCWRSRSDQAGYFTAPAKCATHQGQASSLGSLIIATKSLPLRNAFI